MAFKYLEITLLKNATLPVCSCLLVAKDRQLSGRHSSAHFEGPYDIAYTWKPLKNPQVTQRILLRLILPSPRRSGQSRNFRLHFLTRFFNRVSSKNVLSI